MDETGARELGDYLRRQREAAGMSTRALVTAVDLKDKTQIIRLEQGKVRSPKADLLARIAEALKLRASDVLTMAGYPTTTALPALRPYMRQKYRDLPPEAVDEVEAFVARLAQRHGSGPASGEDEVPR